MGGHNGIKSDLLANSGTANGLSNQYNSEALGIGSSLVPTLTSQMANPQGFNPTTMGQMTTAAEQTAGGSNAGTSGAAGLRAARTRNIGSGQSTISQAGRDAAEQLSQRNAGIQTQNANLKAKQQSDAEHELGSLYGTDVGAGESALGISNSALNNAGNLQNFWQQMLLQGMSSAGTAASGGAFGKLGP